MTPHNAQRTRRIVPENFTGIKKTRAFIGVAVFGLMGCDNVRFGNVHVLWLLWAAPLLLAFYIYSFRTKTRLLQRFAHTDILERISAGVSRQRQYLKAGLILFGFTMAILSLAQFRYGFTWEEVTRRGVDMMLVLDVSDSMLVTDAENGGHLTRLERAKREITDLLRMLQGDRVGLVAFAGTAFTECPLTLDYSAAEMFLDNIDTDLIPVKGTAIGDALEEALHSLEGGNTKSKAIILITDGEDHSGRALEVAQKAQAMGVRIFAIGIGRDEGSPIPLPGGGFRRDRQGEMILSRLDETTLQKIALATGGRYVRSVTGDVDLEKIYLQGVKATLEDQDLTSKRRQRWEERFQWLIGLSIIALATESFISERPDRRKATT
ncbi:MAG: VWA domain-containing protein [Myxococcota bacterium]